MLKRGVEHLLSGVGSRYPIHRKGPAKNGSMGEISLLRRLFQISIKILEDMEMQAKCFHVRRMKSLIQCDRDYGGGKRRSILECVSTM